MELIHESSDWKSHRSGIDDLCDVHCHRPLVFQMAGRRHIDCQWRCLPFCRRYAL